MDYLSFPAMLIYLTTYYLVEKLAKKFYHGYNPEFYDRLYQTRKDLRYFVFVMGIFLALISSPACYKAFRDSSVSNDTLGSPFRSSSGDICMATKGVLWTSELIRLDYSSAYIIHHLSSLTFLVYEIQSGFPLRPLYAYFTSLCTEVASNSVAILFLHGIVPETSSFAYTIYALKMVLLVTLRLPPNLYAITFLHLYSVLDIRFWVHATMIFIYTQFIINHIITDYKRLQIFQIVPTDRSKVRVFRRYKLSIYSIFYSLGCFFTASMATIIFSQNRTSYTNSNNIFYVNSQLLFTGFMAFVGARRPYFTSYTSDSNGRRLWLQGAIFAATLSIVLSPLANRYQFFLSLATALPFGESIGRIGCHFAGCCGASIGTRSKPLWSSLLNAFLGFFTLVCYQLGMINLERAAFIALGFNAMVRIVLRGNNFAVTQLSVSVLMYNFSDRIFVSTRTSADPALTTSQSLGNFIGAMLDPFNVCWTALLATSCIFAGVLVDGSNCDDLVQWCFTRGKDLETTPRTSRRLDDETSKEVNGATELELYFT